MKNSGRSPAPDMKAIDDSFRGLMATVINRALGTDCRAVREQAAALYRRFLEGAGGGGKTPGKPRTPHGVFRENRCGFFADLNL
jgi:hypothetical protein